MGSHFGVTSAIISPMDDATTLKRDALRRYMEAHHLKPGRWAKDAGVSQNTLYNFLNGESDSLSQSTWEKLARHRGLTYSQLISEIEGIEAAMGGAAEAPLLQSPKTLTDRDRDRLKGEALRLFVDAPPEIQEALLTLLRHAVRGTEES